MKQTSAFKSHYLRLLTALIVTFAMLALPGATVRAADITVTNNNDSGPGSLRQAILDASPGDFIHFDNSYTICLASTLTIDKNLTIDGEKFLITLSGDSNGDGNGDVRVLHVNPGTTLNLNKLTITKGYDDLEGAGIYNAGTLLISNSQFLRNNATYYGGGIHNEGVLNISNSIFFENRANVGGGVTNTIYGSVTITNSAFTENHAISFGGGIYTYNGPFTITNSTLFSNSSDRGGGFFNNASNVIVQNTIFANNNGANCENYLGTMTDNGGNLVWG
jgi:hypothetical protein